MKKIKKILMVLLFACIRFIGLQAQEAVPATGGNASGSAGSASYSVGQVVYTTNTGTTASVAQGVQQTYIISVISVSEQATADLILLAYPNPTTNFLTLRVDNFKPSTSAQTEGEGLTFQLCDISGKLLLNQKVSNAETSIPMEKLANGSYFLKVNNNKTEVKTFKIIKN